MLFVLTVRINSWNNWITFILSSTTGHKTEEERNHWLIKSTQISLDGVLFQIVDSGDYLNVNVGQFSEENYHGESGDVADLFHVHAAEGEEYGPES